MRRLTVACVAIIAAGLAGPAAAQSPVAFAGRWRLVTPSPPPDAATELLFTGPMTSQLMLIERRHAAGVTPEQYSADPGRHVMAYEAKWMGPALVLIKRGNGGRGAAPATADHEENWSVGADDVLRIVATDRLRGVSTATARLEYRRVATVLRLGENLLDNPGADRAGADWMAFRDARVEPCDSNPCFVLRNQGSFQQTVLLPDDAAGKYIVMIGSGSSERVHPDNAITGLPTLYGMVAIADGSRFLSYLQGMLVRTKAANVWMTMSGVFPVPAGAARVSFQLNQASGRGVPQNGSAARFDDLGMYIFPTEVAAHAFIATWSGRK